ncbi:MAG TPA: FUSC family protein [Pseudolabrys sp.]|nr:FUSC family protein [Pseudolabrys sp.]
MAWPAIDTVTLRRAILFFVGIGVPSATGTLLGHPAGVLIGCMTGLLFSFADDAGPLSVRYKTLFMAAGGVAIGAAAGAYWRGFPWPVWVMFAAATFASGAFLGVGKAPMLGARFGAMALVVASGAPELRLDDAAYGVLALVVVALARFVDHWIFGPLPQMRGGAPRGPNHDWPRFALAYAAAATVSLWIGIAIDPSRAVWVVVTTLVVMMADARASYVRIVERVAGTMLGVVAAFALTSVVHSPRLIALALLLVAPAVPHHLQQRYWLHTALIALLILLAYDLATADPRILHGLFTERLEDVLLGGALALVGTMVAFPRTAPSDNELA